MFQSLVTYALDVANNGFGFDNIGDNILRLTVGLFFVFSGMNKLFNKARHETITKTLIADHVPAVSFMQWWVPGWEFFGGILLTLNIVPTFAAAVLAVLLTVACVCEATTRVNAYQPINFADRLDDYLYLPEVIYLIVLITIIIS